MIEIKLSGVNTFSTATPLAGLRVSPGNAVPGFHTPSVTFQEVLRRKKKRTLDQPGVLGTLYS